MPPKPLPVLRDGKSYAIHTWSLSDPFFDSRQDIACLALGALASWTNVESTRYHVFRELMGGSKTLSANIFAALQGAKSDAIDVAVKAQFGGEATEVTVHSALKQISKTRESHRDMLAHWVWGYCEEYPDHLLLIDPKSTSFKERPLIDAALLFSRKDFKEIIDNNARLQALWEHYYQVVGIRVQSAKRASQLEKLLTAPELQEILSHPPGARGRRKTG